MASKRKVEVFTAGCPVCEPTVDLVNKLACPSCGVTVYDLREGCITNECRDKVELHGITRLPAVAVNGSLLDCCKVGQISESDLRAAGIGSV
ncbi:MAG: glutaredoxin [Thermodesulfobacteriota bacterium]